MVDLWRRTRTCRGVDLRTGLGAVIAALLPRGRAGVAMLLCLLAQPAAAHVKWFCEYDVTKPPLPLDRVFTSTFVWIGLGFAVLMFIGYAVDRAAVRSGWGAALDRWAARRSRDFQGAVMRIGVAIFFISLWKLGGIILTPELKTDSTVIPWIQLAIGLGVVTAPTCLLSGLGIVGLWLYGESQYGFFHLMDYPIFLGVACWLILTPFQRRGRSDLRLPILYATSGVTLMWAAIEKFGYPMWTEPLLIEHSRITMGFDFDIFMILAGYVEYTLAFFMVTGTALMRLCVFYLLFIFCIAIVDFGLIDAIGHLLIIVALCLMTINGHTVLQDRFRFDGKLTVLQEAGALTALATVVLFGFFGLYYGIQRIG